MNYPQSQKLNLPENLMNSGKHQVVTFKKPLKSLVSKGTSNAKTVKNTEETWIMYISPYDLNSYGKTVCSDSTEGCRTGCLGPHSGRALLFQMITQARIRKTDLYFSDRQAFCEMLFKDMIRLSNRAVKKQITIQVRLNGTSDLDFIAILKNRTGLDIRTLPGLSFYDYTKQIGKFKKYQGTDYKLTFSRSESNQAECIEAIKCGPVAVVFDTKKGHDLPGTFSFDGKTFYPVIDGDKADDLMVNLGSGFILGLRAKGKAKQDQTGFVVRVPVMLPEAPEEVYSLF